MSSKTPGQAAYEAFGATGGFTTVLLTPWVNVSAHTVARWERIAQAAIDASPTSRREPTDEMIAAFER